MTKKKKTNKKKAACYARNSGPALTGAAILAARDLKLVRLEMPEWGGHVFVRPMTAGERDAFDLVVTQKRGQAKIRAYIVALCTVDAKGKRLFTFGDVDHLDEKASGPMTRIFMKARQINKLFVEDIEAAEKNS